MAPGSDANLFGVGSDRENVPKPLHMRRIQAVLADRNKGSNDSTFASRGCRIGHCHNCRLAPKDRSGARVCMVLIRGRCPRFHASVYHVAPTRRLTTNSMSRFNWHQPSRLRCFLFPSFSPLSSRTTEDGRNSFEDFNKM